jgi:arsenate reductase (thioredoxin)
MGCGDTCPVVPGRRYDDWVLTDPAGQPIKVVRDVRDEIQVGPARLVADLLPTTAA